MIDSECGWRACACVSDGSVTYDDGKAELPMKVFSPFAGFLCVVAAFLLILLFVGVVSETGQSQSVDCLCMAALNLAGRPVDVL